MVPSDSPYFLKYIGGQWTNFCLWVMALSFLFLVPKCVPNSPICCLSSTSGFFLPKGINAGSNTQRDLGRVWRPFKSSIWVSFYYWSGEKWTKYAQIRGPLKCRIYFFWFMHTKNNWLVLFWMPPNAELS